jgi:hypothetical protein
MLRSPCILLILAAFHGPTPLRAVELEVSLKPAPAPLTQANFKLFIDDQIAATTPVRGLIGMSSHQGGGALYSDETWRATALKMGFGMFRYTVLHPHALDDDWQKFRRGGTSEEPTPPIPRTSPNPQGGTSWSPEAMAALWTALDQCAEQANRPELRHVPIITTGLSRGAYQARIFAELGHQRVIGFVATHGEFFGELEASYTAWFGVPGLTPIGAKDPRLSDLIMPWVMLGRGKNAPWAATIEPDAGHSSNGNIAFNALWMEAICALRLPPQGPVDQPVALRAIDLTQGWLGELVYTKKGETGPLNITSARVASWADYQGDRSTAHWLPSEAVARRWQEMMTGTASP